MILRIQVKPNAKQARIEQSSDGTWVAWVNAPPVDGKANARLIEIVAEHFGVKKSDVTLQGGATSKIKRILVEGVEGQ